MDENQSSHQSPDRDVSANAPCSQINTTEISDKGEATATRSINNLPFEVLLLIFLHTFDIEIADMHKSFPLYPPKYVPIEEPANRLTSVCRYWKEIVYDTVASMPESVRLPVWLDRKESREQTDKKIKRLRNRQDLIHSTPIADSKSSIDPIPLDVFMTNAVAITFSDSFVWDAFCTRVLMPFTTADTPPFNYTFYSLSVSFAEWSFSRYFGSNDSESITGLRRLHLEWGYKGHAWRPGLEPLSLELDELLGGMKQLEELKLIGWESMRMSEGTRFGSRFGESTLPRLRWMELSVENEVDSRVFTTLLQGAPNLEYIRLEGRIATDSSTYCPPSDQVVVLPHLRKIHLDSGCLLPYPFVNGWIQTPQLLEMFAERTGQPRGETMKSFLAFNTTITKLVFPAEPRYIAFFSEIPNIDDIMVDATGFAREGWLGCLGARETKSLASDERWPICPNLRTLTLLLGPTISSMPTFQTFIRARCIPVDVEENTAIGYKALEQVILRFPAVSTSVMETIETEIGNWAWGDVEMEKGEHDSESEFCLKWRYNSRPRLL